MDSGRLSEGSCAFKIFKERKNISDGIRNTQNRILKFLRLEVNVVFIERV
jgi:hypothetical protein